MAGATDVNVEVMTKFLSMGSMSTEEIALCCSLVPMRYLLGGAIAPDITVKLSSTGATIRAPLGILQSHVPSLSTIQSRSTVLLTAKMTLESLQLFLILLYTDDEATLIGLEEAVDAHFNDLIEGRLHLKVSKFDATLTKALARLLTPENCFDYMFQFWTNNEMDLHAVCEQYVKDNIDEVGRAHS